MDVSNQADQRSSAEKRRRLLELLTREAQAPRSYPLSFAQQRLWFLDQWEPESALYSIPIALRLPERLHVRVLVASLHEIVRTAFVAEDGQPAHVVVRTLRPVLPVFDLSGLAWEMREAELKRLAQANAVHPFVLSSHPLWRIHLLRQSVREQILLMCVHHIIFDG